MQKVITIILFLFISNIIKCQNSKSIEFKNITYTFGKIDTTESNIKTKFKFKNISNNSFIISKAINENNNIIVNFTNNEIKPGKSGFIEVIFNINGVYGYFDKHIIIYTNDSIDKGTKLNIKGNIPENQDISKINFPQAIGNLFFRSNHIAFNKMFNNQTFTDTLWLYNSSTKKMKIEAVNIPSWININPQKIELKSNQVHFILVSYNASKRNDWGLLIDNFTLKTNDNILPTKEIYTSAQIEENFSIYPVSKLENAPEILINENEYNFGEVKEGSNIFHRFEIQNIGKSDLIIRKVVSSCGCTVSRIDKSTLKSGENCFLSVSFNTGGRSGVQEKSITIITNDPKRSIIIFNLLGKIIN